MLLLSSKLVEETVNGYVKKENTKKHTACWMSTLDSDWRRRLCLYELDDKVEEIKVLGKQSVSICA